MANVCPSCGKAELQELVPGVTTCPACRKIFRGAIKVKVEKTETQKTDLQPGEFYMKNTTLNPKWEICDSGITVDRQENKSMIAVLLCHPPDYPNMKYLRISWFKKSINTHAGMFKIQDYKTVDNVIIALERFDALFDEMFNLKDGAVISFDPIPQRQLATQQEIDIFNIDKHLCPNCKWKMKRSQNRRYFECLRCGEIIVIYQEMPIVNFPPESLSLKFSTDFPVNYYLPSYGVTVHQGMADWKSILTIHAKENPEKKWLRFYWWQRNLQDYMKSTYTLGGQGLKWDTKKGAQSPNIYQKELVRPLINALKRMKKEWAKSKGWEYNEIDYEEGKQLTEEEYFTLKREQLLKAIPTKKKTKEVMAKWILEMTPTGNYTEKLLTKKLKEDLYLIVKNIAASARNEK